MGRLAGEFLKKLFYFYDFIMSYGPCEFGQ